jgi:hypothetical protein
MPASAFSSVAPLPQIVKTVSEVITCRAPPEGRPGNSGATDESADETGLGYTLAFPVGCCRLKGQLVLSVVLLVVLLGIERPAISQSITGDEPD